MLLINKIRMKMLIEKTERQAIVDALEKTGGNRAEAAKRLDIHRTGLYQKSTVFPSE